MRKAPRIMFFLAALLATASNTSAENLKWTVTKITDNLTDDTEPSLSAGNIAWRHQRAQEQESDIYYWDGYQALQLTDSETVKARPSASEGSIRVAWVDEAQVLYWDGNQVREFQPGYQVSVNNGSIASVQSLGHNVEDIIYWSGPFSTTYNVSNDNYLDAFPSLNNKQIAWQKDRGEWEIFYWDGIEIRRIDFGERPSLFNRGIAYQGFDGHDWEIYYWNSLEIIQITNNSYHDRLPSLYDGRIAWRADFNNSGIDDAEIMYWDGGTIYRVTNNNVQDTTPSLYANQIVWSGFDGSDLEIFSANPVPEPASRLLFASGLAAWAGVRRKFKKQ